MRLRKSLSTWSPVLLLPSLFLGACGGSSSSSSSFVVRTSQLSTFAATPLSAGGKNLAYLASEATTGAAGTDMNGDADLLDAIAVAVELTGGTETRLDVAATHLAWIANELYLAVEETLDGRDWNGDLVQDDRVLLHWSKAANLLAYVDDLSTLGSLPFVNEGTNLFYTVPTTPVGPLQSNVKVISSAAPLTGTMIPTTDAVAELEAGILLEDEGLIFLVLDETSLGRDLNVDSDTNDTRVLALLDGSLATGVLRNVELALPAAPTPLRARKTASNDWDVGFLVSEADQDGLNLNDPALFSPNWKASHCLGFEDADSSDDVLHFLEFASWNTNPVTAPPRNTGLVGQRRIAIANGFIATIALEADEGTCDLNDDGDTGDEVVRWTQIVSQPTAILPLNTATNIRALFDCPGGTRGLAEIDDKFLICVSESDDDTDIDNDGQTDLNLLGWLKPVNAATAWDFIPGATPTFVGASWMAETRDRSHVNVAFEERVAGQNINAHVPAVPGEDIDSTDSVPTFAHFLSSTIISYPGVAVAVDEDNAGIALARGFTFYRVHESEDARDWNDDGDETDEVLLRTSLTQGTTVVMGSLNALTRNAVEFADETNPVGAAFLASEAEQGPAGTDFNGDGDALDLVVRWFRF